MKKLFRYFRRYFCLSFLLCPNLFAQVSEYAEQEVYLHAPLLKNMGTEFVQESAIIPHEFNVVIMEGNSTDAKLKGEIRFFENGKWSEAIPLYIKFFGTGSLGSGSSGGTMFMASYSADTYRQNQAFETRFSVAEGQSISVKEAGILNNRNDEERNSNFDPALAPQFVPSGRVKTPRLIRRSEWAARPYNCGSPDIQPYYRYLTLHHTAWPVQQNLLASYKNMKDIQDFHIDGNKWCDIGYQFLMDQRGNLFQGRPFMDESKSLASGPALVIGAHVSNGNTGNIGMSLMGCFHPPENSATLNCLDKQNAALLDSVVTMFAFLADTYQISPANIRGHRDFNSTSCPGDVNYALLDEIRWRVKTKLKALGSPVANESAELPLETTLAQNYPNPFNPSTNIRFYLAQTSDINLSAYDILGRKVATLAQGLRNGNQWHNTLFDAKDLPTGSYLFVLTTTNNGQTLTQTQTGILVR